jgi:hypothetical protein
MSELATRDGLRPSGPDDDFGSPLLVILTLLVLPPPAQPAAPMRVRERSLL